ncbi:hypothetical protein JZ751_005708 [Albula glossodonta]|uniref:Uncharacterized protein n=1 Tax=Albula glossodonta TaxID=121402 RepID=A0A8T2N3M4_9TELE|nr:hypothetical protein JZ751_005708 [Albula glossodonta]
MEASSIQAGSKADSPSCRQPSLCPYQPSLQTRLALAVALDCGMVLCVLLLIWGKDRVHALNQPCVYDDSTAALNQLNAVSERVGLARLRSAALSKGIDPKVAFPRRAQPKLVTRTKKIFVGGLSVNTTIEDVKQYFDQFGKVYLATCSSAPPDWLHTNTHSPVHCGSPERGRERDKITIVLHKARCETIRRQEPCEGSDQRQRGRERERSCSSEDERRDRGQT